MHHGQAGQAIVLGVGNPLQHGAPDIARIQGAHLLERHPGIMQGLLPGMKGHVP
jgi:hypothetical protein